jgi:hypothetical protein
VVASDESVPEHGALSLGRPSGLLFNLEICMSTENANVVTAGDDSSPWVDGVGFVLRISGVRASESMTFALQNDTQGGASTSVVFGPYRPNGGPGWESAFAGVPIAFQMWGSSDGSASDMSTNFPAADIEFNARALSITFPQKLVLSTKAAYYFTCYAWYKSDVRGLSIKRTGGNAAATVVGIWVDTDGDYQQTTDLSTLSTSVPYKVTQPQSSSSSSQPSSSSSKRF